MIGFLVFKGKTKKEVIQEKKDHTEKDLCVFVVIVAVRRKTPQKHNFFSLQTCFISFLRFCYGNRLCFLICVLFL